MNSNQLGSQIVSKLNSLSDESKRDASQVWQSVAEAIIDHIKNNAEIASLTQSGIVVVGSASVASQGKTVPAQGVIS